LKEAAEINDFVCSDALVIPTGVPVAVITSRATTTFYRYVSIMNFHHVIPRRNNLTFQVS
jgi:hypothetical protein